MNVKIRIMLGYCSFTHRMRNDPRTIIETPVASQNRTIDVYFFMLYFNIPFEKSPRVNTSSGFLTFSIGEERPLMKHPRKSFSIPTRFPFLLRACRTMLIDQAWRSQLYGAAYAQKWLHGRPKDVGLYITPGAVPMRECARRGAPEPQLVGRVLGRPTSGSTQPKSIQRAP